MGVNDNPLSFLRRAGRASVGTGVPDGPPPARRRASLVVAIFQKHAEVLFFLPFDFGGHSGIFDLFLNLTHFIGNPFVQGALEKLYILFGWHNRFLSP